jgi:hypothetical protein
MPPDHDDVNGSVNLGAESVMREIVSPVPVRLRRIPDRQTGDHDSRIFFPPRKLPWLVPARSLAGLTADPRTGLNFALVPYCPAEQVRSTA